jgi:hypothetical protein
VLKDQANKKAHEDSAQLACEAAAAIRTVASLTREDDCCNLYSKSLDEPLKKSNKTALGSNLLYAFSQATAFFVIALVFWYGSRLVSSLEISTFRFFCALMVSRQRSDVASRWLIFLNFRLRHLVPSKLEMSSHSCPISRPQRALVLILSSCLTPCMRSTLSPLRARISILSNAKAISVLRMSTSDTRLALESVFCATLIWKSLREHILPWLVPVDRARVLCMFLLLSVFYITDFLDSIQLVERFYDPLAGNVYVRI